MSYDVNDGTVSSYDSRIGYYLISAGYTHDDLMRLSGVEYSIGTEDEDYPNTVTQTYDYLTYTDAADDEYESHLISSVTTVFPQNGGTETLNYTYDSNGNITEILRGTTVLCRYEYDDLGQLVREDNSDLGKTYVWDYDDAGNILSKKTYAYTTGTLGSAPSTISYGYGNSAWGDLLTSYYGNTITYDAIGNPLSWGDYGELTWQGRRLESYTDSESEETFTYTYNSDGIRTSKTVNGVEHIYHLSGTQILSEEWTENGVQHLLIYIYDASGAPIGMAYRDSTYVSGDFDIYLFAKNIQGDILYIYNTSGTRLVTYTYDAWGNVTTSYSNGGASTAARYNPFRYRGYYYDTETGFYYLNSRYYDPAVGRFLNADGYVNANGDILGFNMFAYCGNNPVMFKDPSGNWLERVQSILIHISQKVFQSIAKFMGGFLADMMNFDKNNESEEKVLNSNYFSSYKGKLVIRTDGDRSGSFGVIFLTRETNDRMNPEDVVRHEYGHTIQLEQLGILKYALNIGLPSWQNWGTGDYYDKPWEITADIYGGVQSRIHEQMYIEKGLEYLEICTDVRFMLFPDFIPVR